MSVSTATNTLRREIMETRREIVETRRHIDIRAERLETRFDLVVEGLQATNERMDRNIAEVHETIALTAAETQAMIRFSHDELHNRVLKLEQNRSADPSAG